MEYSDEQILDCNFLTRIYTQRYTRAEKKEIGKYPILFKKKSKELLRTAREGEGCHECGTVNLLQVHHKDHIRDNNEDSNLQVLCFYCHAKHHKHMQNKLPPIWLK